VLYIAPHSLIDFSIKVLVMRWARYGLVCFTLFLVAGCGGTTPPTPTAVPRPTIDISKLGKNVIMIYDDRVEPKTITIKLGESVTWVNSGSSNHGMRSTRGVKRFSTGIMQPGRVVETPFDEVGETEFADTQNPDKITGKIIVVAP